MTERITPRPRLSAYLFQRVHRCPENAGTWLPVILWRRLIMWAADYEGWHSRRGQVMGMDHGRTGVRP